MVFNRNKFLTITKFLVILLMINLSSCQSSKNKKVSETQLSFPIYGNYCGPLYPPKGSKPIPIDAIDNACKNHDMCYDYYGYLDKDCDKAIINELQLVTPETEAQNLIRKLLIAYFVNIQKI